jgi:hypothetical protein
MKVYQGRYYPRYKLKEMSSHLGSDQEQHGKFVNYRKWIVIKYAESGEVDVAVRWPSDEQIEQVVQDAVVVEQPADLYIPWMDYVQEHSDPRTNGKGHQTGHNSKNELCVIVPESNVEKRR